MSDPDTYTGKIYTASFYRTDQSEPACGLDDCPCPEHEWLRDHPIPAGTYITVQLDGDPRIRLGVRYRITEVSE